MEDVVRQRRALFIASLILLAVNFFGIEGEKLSAGGLELDFGEEWWLYAILTVAWAWETYRYWLVQREPRAAAYKKLRDKVIKGVPQTALVSALRPRAKAEILKTHGMASESLESVDFNDWVRDTHGWNVIWTWKQTVEGKPHRPRIGSHATVVRPKDVPWLYCWSVLREWARDVYPTEYVAPWFVAVAPAVVFLVYRLPRDMGWY